MTANARALLKKILKLPRAQRVGLAYEILESVESREDEGSELSPEWRAEIERRYERILSGEAGAGEDYRAVMKRIRKRYESKYGRAR